MKLEAFHQAYEWKEGCYEKTKTCPVVLAKSNMAHGIVHEGHLLLHPQETHVNGINVLAPKIAKLHNDLSGNCTIEQAWSFQHLSGYLKGC
jgi:hypothetical protein